MIPRFKNKLNHLQDYRCTKIKEENTFSFDKDKEQSPASECQAIGYHKETI